MKWRIRASGPIATLVRGRRLAWQRLFVLCAWIMALPILSGCTGGDGPAPRVLSFTGDTVAVIGAVDGADHEVFGRIIAAAAHERHGLFLLDLQTSSVLWYGLDGTFRRSVAARGQGPGEFGTAWAIHVDPEGQLWVLDRGNARITRFLVGGTGDVAFDGSIPSVFPDGSLCTLEGRLFRGGLRNGHMLHETGEDGTLVRSIGPAPAVPDVEAVGAFRPLVESQVLRGQVYCAEDQGVVVVAASSHPLVRAFDANGAIRWETYLEGITPIGFLVTAEGSLVGNPDPVRGANFLRSIVRWDESTLLLQYEIRMPGPLQDDREFFGLDSRLIDVGSGHEVAQSKELPLIGARAGEHIVLLENLPFPRAVVVRLRNVT